MLAEAEGAAIQIQHVETLVAALDELANADGAFDVCLVDLSLPDCQGFETFTTLQAHAPGLPIVILTGIDSESFALQAVRSGAQDYLVKAKLDTQSLLRAVRYAAIRRGSAAEKTAAAATVIGVLSSKGGMGTTTVACHFALEIREQTSEKVLLLDLDVSSAGAGFLMRTVSPYTTLDATTNLHRLDADYWRGVVCPTNTGVDLLQSPGSARIGEQLNGERVRHVTRCVRSFYRWIVVDLGRLAAVSIQVLPEVKDLLLVTTPELSALYEVKRVIQRLLDLGFDRDRIHLIVNRVSKESGPVEDLEKVLGHPVRAMLSECSKEIYDAMADGRFLTSDLPLRRQIVPLVSKLVGKPETAATQRRPKRFRFAWS
jgi:pilus assembly protein CpaE